MTLLIVDELSPLCFFYLNDYVVVDNIKQALAFKRPPLGPKRTIVVSKPCKPFKYKGPHKVVIVCKGKATWRPAPQTKLSNTLLAFVEEDLESYITSLRYKPRVLYAEAYRIQTLASTLKRKVRKSDLFSAIVKPHEMEISNATHADAIRRIVAKGKQGIIREIAKKKKGIPPQI